ncbi:MAG TPA: alpha/beta fold hydrolase [Tessaracoccus flavescens]|uniref:Alpha/beta fold hydrolase n=1 Tax=Tessaracoccus flavescens TaxID=399497 RepID=A0A921EMM0_9ACTN|nr:alpha/beta fold hydrolase [Tessaracoccus flavescens]
MKLHSLTVGSGPIHAVFLHGLFGQGKNWGSIASALANVATCHLVDLPNHGRSPWTESFSLDGQADEVIEWLEETFDEPVALIGHSLGGKIAMRIALRQPSLVDRLMIVDISPARNVAAANFVNLVAALRTLNLDEVSSRTFADKELAELIPDVVVRRFLLQNLRLAGEHWFWLANLDLLGDSLHKIGGWDPIDGTYDGPVLWVNGGRSPYVQPEHLAPMRELFPRVLQVTLKRAGHWVHADDPEAFTAVADRFLATTQE